MEETSEQEQLALMVKIGVGSLVVAGILVLVIFIAHNFTKIREGQIVLPAGGTYLGPSPTPAAWKEMKGTIYPFTLSVPETLSLTTFPEDPYDIYALAENPSSNVLIGVEDLNKVESRKPFVKKSKKEYVETFWWKQFNLAGVEKIEDFTNEKGLQGYKVKFKTSSGLSPYDDVFFEVPDKPNLIIHLSNMTLSTDVFEKIVESVGWE